MLRKLSLLALCLLIGGCAEPTESDEVASAQAATANSAAEPSGEAKEIETGKDVVVSDKYNELNDWESKVILEKYTERAFTGEYDTTMDPGTYICRQCNAQLYRSDDKFDAHCGWPAFDDEIEGAVKQVPDADGMRTEIVCANCDGHLGHVFVGERKTAKNVRHCVNSISMLFVPEGKEIPPKIVLGDAAKPQE